MEVWKGIYKLQEEIGEVGQVLGKLGAFPYGKHPDGAGDLKHRLEDELADMVAAAEYVIGENLLDDKRIQERMTKKLEQFKAWGLSGIKVS